MSQVDHILLPITPWIVAPVKMTCFEKSMGIVPNGVQGATGLTPDTAEVWAGILEHFAIDFEEKWQEEAAIEYTRKVLRLST